MFAILALVGTGSVFLFVSFVFNIKDIAQFCIPVNGITAILFSVSYDKNFKSRAEGIILNDDGSLCGLQKQLLLSAPAIFLGARQSHVYRQQSFFVSFTQTLAVAQCVYSFFWGSIYAAAASFVVVAYITLTNLGGRLPTGIYEQDLERILHLFRHKYPKDIFFANAPVAVQLEKSREMVRACNDLFDYLYDGEFPYRNY